jgi:SAM-dependent methyltransferase
MSDAGRLRAYGRPARVGPDTGSLGPGLQRATSTDTGSASIGSASTGSAPTGSASTGPNAAVEYDLLPYPSMPFPETQPAHLAALATLFGMTAPDVDRARVLELGCASGGNIIPLAARLPQAHFVGFDLSRRHIDDGRKRIAALGLANITLEQADLTSLDLGGQEFDYIVCNGVLSWVPPATREAILRLCRQALSPNGVATVSYNAFPGWHLRMVIRDLCLHYAGTEGSPRQRVARARAALEQIAANADTAEPYGLLLRAEARRLRGVPASYILGEFLAPDNAPCTVTDFAAQAGDNGLDYLCELDICAGVPQALVPAMRQRLMEPAGADRMALEQHVDFLTGRLLRRSVLVRRPSTSSPPRALAPLRLDMLHISSPIRLDPTEGAGGASVFRDPRGRPITVPDARISRALARLGQAFPASLTLHELSTDQENAAGADDISARLREVVLALVLAGRASVSTHALRVGAAAGTRPAACRVARMEAQAGQPWITSLRHAGVPVNPVIRAMLPHLDGTRDRAMLRDLLSAALRDGAVKVPELTNGQPPSQDRIDLVAAEYVELGLAYLAQHGLLESTQSRS